MQAYWAKEEADTTPATAENIVNKRISVFWSAGAKGWYNGTVISFEEGDCTAGECEIRYDDGSEDIIPLDHRVSDESGNEEWPWKRGEYTKAGKRKPPKVSADKKKKKEVEIILPPAMSLADMTVRFNDMLAKQLEEAKALTASKDYSESRWVLQMRRRFCCVERNSDGEFPLVNGDHCPAPTLPGPCDPEHFRRESQTNSQRSSSLSSQPSCKRRQTRRCSSWCDRW